MNITHHSTGGKNHIFQVTFLKKINYVFLTSCSEQTLNYSVTDVRSTFLQTDVQIFALLWKKAETLKLQTSTPVRPPTDCQLLKAAYFCHPDKNLSLRSLIQWEIKLMMTICRQVILSQIILLNHPTCQKEQLRPRPPDLKHAPSHHLRLAPPVPRKSESS